jgi:hypothetical protein
MEGKPLRHNEEIPTSSPLRRKMYLDLNCPSPKIMSTENLQERVRHSDEFVPGSHAVNDLITPELSRPLLNVVPAVEPGSPLVRRDWLSYHQEQYLRSLQGQDVAVSPNAKSVQNSDDTQLSSGERFLQNWLHGRPSVGDDIGISNTVKKEDDSSRGAEIGVDLLHQSDVRNTGVGNVLKDESPEGNVDKNNEDDPRPIIDLTLPRKQNLADMPESVKPEKLQVDQCSGSSYVESWLQVNQQAMHQYCANNTPGGTVGRKFEKIPVTEPLNTPKLRNLQVSFSEACSQIPDVEILPDSVGIEMFEEHNEAGRNSGNSSYCTQSTVNSMKALLSSTE